MPSIPAIHDPLPVHLARPPQQPIASGWTGPARMALASLWFGGVAGTGTAIGLLSHMGFSTSTTRVALAQTSATALTLTGLVAGVWVVLALLAYRFEGLRPRLSQLRRLFMGLALSGMPWTFACAVLLPKMGVPDFWALAGAGGLVAFLLWLRTLQVSWLVAIQLWRGSSSPISVAYPGFVVAIQSNTNSSSSQPHS